MGSDLVFYQLALVVLVWLFVMLCMVVLSIEFIPIYGILRLR